MEEFTVSRLSSMIKLSLEEKFSGICLKAEVSALKVHSSGHLYFALKDNDAVIDAVCWKGVAAKQKIQLQDGLMIRCIGDITAYAKQSKYQFVVKSFEAAGVGELLKMLEERKKKLAAEGLFDLSRKKPIPKIPHLIGIITSPTGAVIKDMMHRLTQRFPREVLLWPVLVQGSEASKQIVEAIEGMNRLERRPDVLIVARGGGSFEDLMPFNEENIVRAVAASEIPVISAVGHETDTTLIDYAADLRAPTPTAAAEFAVPERVELLAVVSRIFSQLNSAMKSKMDRNRLLLSSNKITNLQNFVLQKAQTADFMFEKVQTHLNNCLAQKKLRVEQVNLPVPQLPNADVYNKIPYLMTMQFDRAKSLYERLAQALESNSYRSILQKGFALVENKKGKTISTAEVAMQHSEFDLVFLDGKVSVQRKPTQTELF